MADYRTYQVVEGLSAYVNVVTVLQNKVRLERMLVYGDVGSQRLTV